MEIDDSPLFAHPAVDSLTYTQHAERLAAGNWLGRGDGPFWQPPLYPYLLGVLKTLFPESFFYVVRLVQALLGALTCVLIYWLGRQVARPVVAAAAAVATTLCGSLIFFDGELLPASLATFLNLAGLALLWRALQGPSGTWLSGCWLGLRTGRTGRAHGPRLRAGGRGLGSGGSGASGVDGRPRSGLGSSRWALP